ncbi:MAG: DNA replication and repair protein RecF [Pseudolabrys sp.]|nr:DNA replication and repair protein RecF [Gemmatimonadaceae bacterium]MBX3553037.1 DNA replication and repair protein RecF [Pseudolabrys sp.]MCW5825974.1 DNA replication and repair protein RecF [Gemmatimonadaceae bacterium]
MTAATTPKAARLASLALRDFRNITAAEIAFPAEGVAFVGENGQGKTNAVEAIAYFRLLRSMRGARDRDLIRFGATAFHLAATMQHGSAERATVGADRTGRKKVTLDGAEPEKLAEALDVLPSVSFSPRDVDLIAGAPSERRRYLDITLALTSPSYLHALRRYRAALVRRNASLRDAARRSSVRTALAAAAAWEPALAEHGAVLVQQRRAWAAAHAASFAALCAAIGESQPATLTYEGLLAESEHPREELLALLDRQREQDCRRGLTQSGPHRDDLALRLDAHDLRQVGSAGQQRTAAIVLRMLESATHREATGVIPVLLLDDPFAELDRRRTARILGLLEEQGVGQCVLCVPREDEIPARFTRLQRWRVQGGAFAVAGDA